MSEAPQDRSPAAGGAISARRRLLARKAAHASWARTADRAARAAPGAQGLLQRFERQVDPRGELPPDLRRAMALHARTAHMLELAARSAAVRRHASRSATGSADAVSDAGADDRAEASARRTPRRRRE